MQITLNTGETSPEELTALIALLASLGGRLPHASTVTVEQGADKAVAIQTLKEEAVEALPSEQMLAAAAAQAVPPPPPANDEPPAVDSAGIPWDARIHSESKAIIADGTWRKRRGVDEVTYGQVYAELQERVAAGNRSDDPPPPPPADEEDAPPPPPAAAESAPTAAERPASEPAASAPAAGNGHFDGFPAFVSAVSKFGKSYAELNELAGMLGVAAFKDMKDHADQWDAFFAML